MVQSDTIKFQEAKHSMSDALQSRRLLTANQQLNLFTQFEENGDFPSCSPVRILETTEKYQNTLTCRYTLTSACLNHFNYFT